MPQSKGPTLGELLRGAARKVQASEAVQEIVREKVAAVVGDVLELPKQAEPAAPADVIDTTGEETP